MHKRILIIDDDESIQELLRLIVEDNGWEAVVLSSCESPKKIEKMAPNLILMDLWMPGIGGEELTKQLKTYLPTQHIPIVIMSALNEAEHIAARAGSDSCLVKPFDVEVLEQTLRSYLFD